MSKKSPLTIHLSTDEKEVIQEAADAYGISIKFFIEKALPYLARKTIQTIKDNK